MPLVGLALALLVALILIVVPQGVLSSGFLGAGKTTARFVAAINRGDYRTACAMYSPRYLKTTQTECRRLYAWGFTLYGPYRYRVLGTHMLATHHYRVSISSRGKLTAYLEFAREPSGWKLVHGGW
jgi:hypothetical protein